ncbi:MAG: MarC family protein [Candidatus Cyclobacteriaceae bacterium M3_2C_046]
MNLADFFAELVKNTIALFSIMNPLSAGAIMLSLMQDDTHIKQSVRHISKSNTLAVFIGMIATFFVGNLILEIFDISINSVKAIGGIVLLLMAINMVQGGNQKVNYSKPEQEQAILKEDISVIPLGIPIILGPGLFATLLSLRTQTGEFLGYLSLILSIVICCLGSYLILRNMIYIKRIISEHGMKIFNRIMGLIVGAISIQFLISGIKVLWQTL